VTEPPQKLDDDAVQDLLHRLVFELEGKEGLTHVGDSALRACRVVLVNMLAAVIVSNEGKG
jgi:hypothetical protein